MKTKKTNVKAAAPKAKTKSPSKKLEVTLKDLNSKGDVKGGLGSMKRCGG